MADGGELILVAEEDRVKLQEIVRAGVMGGLVAALAAGCGKGGDKADPPKDPAQAALAEFRDFVKATYPATPWNSNGRPMTCEVKLVDVTKAESTVSPYTGVLEATGRAATVNEANKGAAAIFKLKFTNDGTGWKCDPKKSTGGVQEEGYDVSPKDGAASCELIDLYCKGKDPAAK